MYIYKISLNTIIPTQKFQTNSSDYLMACGVSKICAKNGYSSIISIMKEKPVALQVAQNGPTIFIEKYSFFNVFRISVVFSGWYTIEYKASKLAIIVNICLRKMN